MDNSTTKPLNVLIDFGSSGVKAVVVRENLDHSLNVLAVENQPSVKIVSKGGITNTSQLGFEIHKIICLLSNQLKGLEDHIDEVGIFVTIGGRNLQAVSTTVKRDQIQVGPIRQERLDEMLKEVHEKITAKYPKIAVLAVTPTSYTLDGISQDKIKLESKPQAQQIVIEYTAFVDEEEMLENVKSGFQHAGCALKHFWVRPECLRYAILSQEEQVTGAAILDFGAQTTSISIYGQNRCIKHHTVTNGGYNITHDIEKSIHLPYSVAENVKCQFGLAAEKFVSENRVMRFRPEGEETPIEFTTSFLAQIIEARLDEIMQPIIKTLSENSAIVKVVYLTGGGAKLKGLRRYLQEKITAPVYISSHADWLEEDAPKIVLRPEYAAVIGLASLAAEYSGQILTPPPFPQPPKKKGFKAFMGSFGSLLEKVFAPQDGTQNNDSQTSLNF